LILKPLRRKFLLLETGLRVLLRQAKRSRTPRGLVLRSQHGGLTSAHALELCASLAGSSSGHWVEPSPSSLRHAKLLLLRNALPHLALGTACGLEASKIHLRLGKHRLLCLGVIFSVLALVWIAIPLGRARGLALDFRLALALNSAF
jgi:hypothetical protein